MANRFEKKGGFAGMAAVRRTRNRTTFEKIGEVDAEHRFMQADHAIPPNRPDCKEMMEVVRQCDLEEGSPAFADKGCGSQANRCDLEEAGLFDGVNVTGGQKSAADSCGAHGQSGHKQLSRLGGAGLTIPQN